jgi:type II secretory pathway pseudopilin PulG
MKKLLHRIMSFRLRKGILRSPKSRHRRGFASGFTLIELLVAALIASLMVVVMLGFLVGVLDSDRKETVKTNAQEELQAAISYMADDLQESIFIYGAEGLASINAQLPHTQTVNPSTECNPTSNTCTPILVFWKRFAFDPDSTRTYSNTGATPTSEIIGCMPYGDATQLAACRTNSVAGGRAYGRDTYTYSLVAYYLKNDTANPETSGWSNTARILRWELRDGYVAYCAAGGAIGTTGCPALNKVSTRAASALIVPPIVPVALTDPNTYFILPSQGFNRPDFSTQGGLALWRKYANFDFAADRFVTLVDFMDDTAYNANQGGNNDAGDASGATAAIRIPIGKNVIISGITTNPDCDDPSIGVGSASPVTVANPTGIPTQRVPADFTSLSSNPSGLSSFYICITPDNVTARIFLRGNAIARLTTPATNRDLRQPTATNITFFPTADVRSFGRSQIGLGR